jgi:predicted O-linked N-acetylglucosamine transferase (SPINDLY family)
MERQPRVVLHVGCGPRESGILPEAFRGPRWRAVRLDIDPRVCPDIVAALTDMAAVATESVDAIWSAHNLEHLHAHEVPRALNEFHRVLKPAGQALIVLPDLQRAAELVAADKLEETAYASSAGPVTPLDMIYGLQAAIAAGNGFMSHRTGFTARTLGQHLVNAGFDRVKVSRVGFDLQAVADKAPTTQAQPATAPGVGSPRSSPVAELLEQARRAHQGGDLNRAERLYREALQADAGCADALHLLGLLAYQRGQNERAIELMEQALARRGGNAACHNNLGLACTAAGRLDEAVTHFREAMRIDPGFGGAHSNLGTTLSRLGQLDEAAACFRAALGLQPDQAVLHYNLGNTLLKQASYEEAVACYDRALHLRADYPEAWNNRGSALQNLERVAEALTSFDQALRRRPDFVDAHHNRALLLETQGRLEEAIAGYRHALEIDPNHAAGYHSLGNAQGLLDRPFDALANLRRAAQLSPEDPGVLISFANALKALGMVDEAVDACRRATALKPEDAHAHNTLGNALLAQGFLDEAIGSYREALRLRPAAQNIHSNLLIALNYLPNADSGWLLEQHRQWARRHTPAPEGGSLVRSYPHARDPERRLRIGYLSPDYRQHPVASFLEPILANHDARRVEVFAYADIFASDSWTERLRDLVTNWRTIAWLKTAQVVEQIEKDQVDILVELTGHFERNRLLVMAERPAPVQATYLGYPSTTGLETIQYRLTDAIADPPGEPLCCTEELVRLPGCFCCYAPLPDTPTVGPLPARQTGRITFGAMHALAKLNDTVLDMWSQILKAVPSSRLLLYRNTLHGATRDLVRRWFTDRGISGDRIDLWDKANAQGQYLWVHGHIDLVLDAGPWTGHTTSCEALWMGVPMVTLRGSRFAGRMAASLLHHVGLKELIAETPAQFVALATRLALDWERLATLRSGLREQMRTSPLCDGATFTKNLEAAYRALWRRWCEDSA